MYQDLKNNIDFFIRNKTQISRKNFVERNPELINRNVQENNYIYDILNQCFEKKHLEDVKILDIGSKNFFYAAGLHRYFSEYCQNFVIDGIEIDAHRLYANFYSRYEVAKYYIKNFNNINYITGNVLDLNKKYDYITWFLPFVLEYPHIKWGLPKRYFYPEKVLSHVLRLLKDNGQLLIINQGENEANAQEELLNKLRVSYKKLGLIKNEKFKYKNERYVFLITH